MATSEYERGYADGIRYTVEADNKTWHSLKNAVEAMPQVGEKTKELLLQIINLHLRKNQSISRDVATIMAKAAEREGDNDGGEDQGEAEEGR